MQIQATATVQGGLVASSGGNFVILDIGASLGEHPHGDGALRLFMTIVAVASFRSGSATA